MENKENENSNNGTGLNKTLYTGMKGKKVTLWKFIVGIILLLGGLYLVFSQLL